jgi:hypothetical protein
MKQGRASSSGMGATVPTLKAQGVNPGHVAQMGNMVGNHVTDKGTIHVKSSPMYKGRGIEAPRKATTVHNKGSQGSY